MPTSTSKANIERLAAKALANAIKAGHARGGPSSPKPSSTKTRRNRRQRRQTRRNRHQTRRN